MTKTILVLSIGLSLFGCAIDMDIPIAVSPGEVNWRESFGGICGVYVPER